MISLRKLTAGAVAAAVLITSATPALARHRYNGYGNGYGWGHRHRNHVDAGDVVAGVVVVGILAAILSSSAKKKREREAGRDGYPEQRGNITSEDAAVDACVTATEAQFGDRASVRDITQVDRNADGWDVEGVVQKRIDWRDSRNAEQRRFTCSVRYGAVDNVYIDTDTLALN
jgi:hypothetical protein